MVSRGAGEVPAGDGDFSLEAYIAVQKVLCRMGEAARLEVPVAWLYMLLPGSKQAKQVVQRIAGGDNRV
jgi:hypothetical protein